jgi:hypothetical protein
MLEVLGRGSMLPRGNVPDNAGALPICSRAGRPPHHEGDNAPRPSDCSGRRDSAPAHAPVAGSSACASSPLLPRAGRARDPSGQASSTSSISPRVPPEMVYFPDLAVGVRRLGLDNGRLTSCWRFRSAFASRRALRGTRGCISRRLLPLQQRRRLASPSRRGRRLPRKHQARWSPMGAGPFREPGSPNAPDLDP